MNLINYDSRWDLQNLREMKRVEYLKARHNGQNKNNEEELTTLLPNPANIKAIEVTSNVPVSAFGCNLHVKKNSAPLVHCICYKNIYLLH